MISVAFAAFWADGAEALSCSMDAPGPDVTFVGTTVAVTDRPEWEEGPVGSTARIAVEEVWREPDGFTIPDRVEIRWDGPALEDGYRPAGWSPTLFTPGERYLIDAVVTPDGDIVTQLCRGGARSRADDISALRPSGARLIEQPEEIRTEPWSPGPPWRTIAIVAGIVLALGLARVVWIGERSGYEPPAKRRGDSRSRVTRAGRGNTPA